jgi:hypothetical protein
VDIGIFLLVSPNSKQSDDTLSGIGESSQVYRER